MVKDNPLLFPVGVNDKGETLFCDLTRMPHLLVGGKGKEAFLQKLIGHFLTKDPRQVQLLLADTDRSLSLPEPYPHLMTSPATAPSGAISLLSWTLVEMMRRYEVFQEEGVRDRIRYNEAYPENPLCTVVVVVTELADLMRTSPAETEEVLTRLAYLGRAAGIHAVVATRRPTTDTLTGILRANIPARIVLPVDSLEESLQLLNKPGAEKLAEGELYYFPVGSAIPLRLKG